jgi:cytochrome P450
MAIAAGELIDYPMVHDDGLDVDPVYKELQRQGPIRVRLPHGEPCWLATTYEDVRTVYGDRRFGKELGLDRDGPRMFEHWSDDPALLANMDPPRHTRLRRLTSPALSPTRVRSMRGWVEGLVDEALDAMVEEGAPADFVSHVVQTVPIRVVTGILGVPREEVDTFRGWVDKMMSIDTPDQERGLVHASLQGYIKSLIAERRRHPTDDLLSVLVEARDEQDRLSEDELLMLGVSLFLGGFETTAAQLGSTVFTLMAYRRYWQELLDDRSLLPAALEEMWRWIPSFKYGLPLVRWASEDVKLSGGVMIRAGDPILPEHAVANRDESVFPHGWELDFHRQDPRPHLALAFGAHHCMGAHVAHVEVEVTVERMLTRFPDLELAVPPNEVSWSPSSFLRSVLALPLTW